MISCSQCWYNYWNVVDKRCLRIAILDCVLQVYGKTDKSMKRIWQRVRNFISKPKYDFPKKKKGSKHQSSSV